MRVIWFLLLSVLGGFWSPDGAVQADAGADAASQKINLAGRQRMLTQRMAAAACMVISDADGVARAAIAQLAHDEFSDALKVLRRGDQEKNLPLETEPSVLEALAEVDDIWADFGPAVQQLAAGDRHSVVFLQLLQFNLPALTRSHTVVQRIVATHGDHTSIGGLANEINIAGRQRMLSQKMLKEACFTATGLSPRASAAALMASINTFESALTQLRFGNPADGISAPPNGAVATQLQAVATLWAEYRAALLSLAQNDGSGLDRAALTRVAAMADTVLAETHRAVQLYVDQAADEIR